MARARNIKPGFFTNDVLAELPALTRLLFAGLWTIADRDGRLEDRPKRIKAAVLPYDEGDVDAMLSELQDKGFILRYDAAGTPAIQVLTWDKHQNPHVKEAASSIAAPDKNSASTGQAQCSAQPEPERAGLIPSSLIPDSLNPISPAIPDGFGRFWAAWPKSDRKEAKGKCLEAWRKAKAEACADAVVAHVERMKASPMWTKQGGEFIPAPLAYLNQRRWEGAEGGGPDPDWWRVAGFSDRFEAENAGCRASNAAQFRNGRRLETA